MAARIAMNMSQQPMPHMTTEHGILTLTQWLSPAFPVGAFAYSHGLETAIAAGAIATGDDLHTWLADVLEFGSGRSDCILLRAAHGCQDQAELNDINAAALAFCASSERQMETRLQGAAFCSTASAIWDAGLSDLAYPVAVGAAAAHLKIDLSLTVQMYLHAFTSNLISAAVRLIPLGQTDGQRVLAALAPLCQNIAADTQGLCLDDLQSTAFVSDIAAMRHEVLQPRIFRS